MHAMRLVVGLFCTLIVFGTSADLPADVKYLDLTNPFIRKIPMAVPVFQDMQPDGSTSPRVSAFADKLQDMLEFSGYFICCPGLCRN